MVTPRTVGCDQTAARRRSALTSQPHTSENRTMTTAAKRTRGQEQRRLQLRPLFLGVNGLQRRSRSVQTTCRQHLAIRRHGPTRQISTISPMHPPEHERPEHGVDPVFRAQERARSWPSASRRLRRSGTSRSTPASRSRTPPGPTRLCTSPIHPRPPVCCSLTAGTGHAALLPARSGPTPPGCRYRSSSCRSCAEQVGHRGDQQRTSNNKAVASMGESGRTGVAVRRRRPLPGPPGPG